MDANGGTLGSSSSTKDVEYYNDYGELPTPTKTGYKFLGEIKYDPNNVDDERFLLFMNDGNYVYINLNKFKSINSYMDIIKKFKTEKGILFLDSGEYFKVLN